jgi:hypothetical protein
MHSIAFIMSFYQTAKPPLAARVGTVRCTADKKRSMGHAHKFGNALKVKKQTLGIQNALV